MTSDKKPHTLPDEHYGIKILKDGTWLYNGTPITRHNLVRLFASVLKKDDLGHYWLETPYERGRIEVEDAPFTAVEMQAEGGGADLKIRLRTNLDDWVDVGMSHPLRVAHNVDTGAPSPYVMVRGGMEAKITRAVFYDMVKLAVKKEGAGDILGIWSGGCFYDLGKT